MASFKIYANLMPGYELVVPHFQSRKLKANAAMKQHAPAVHAAIGEGRGSKMAGMVASAAESLSTLPVIGSFAATAGAVARGAESVLSWFGFTREFDERMPIPVTQRSITNVAHVDGTDPSDLAALMSANEVSIDPTLNGFASEDCLALADFMSRWVLVDTFVWSSADPSMRWLSSVPVTPSYCRQFAEEDGDNLFLTTAGYVGLPFSYWRGTMEYLIIIPVSKFHRGALQLVWTPLGAALDGTDVTNVSLNVIFDVSENVDREVVVGFARENPVLHNTIITDRVPIVDLGSTNGTLHFRVINPLVAQASTASTSVFVFARGKNVQFGVPRDSLRYIDEAPLPNPLEVLLYDQVVLQAKGALGDDSDLGVARTVLVPESGTYPSDKILFGEEIVSIRALLQKPSLIRMLSFAPATNIVLPMYFTMPGRDWDGGAQRVWTWSAYYRAPFLGFAGSERVKMIPNSPCYLGASRAHVDVNPPVDILSTVPTMAPVTFCGANIGAEFVIPYYHDRKFLLSREVIQRNEPGPKILLFARSIDIAQPQQVEVFHCLGPDVRATCFRQLPAVKLMAEKSAGYPWFE